ncbi:MAG TPA: DUF3237 domain-containing protein [Polyangiaceae bacterium]|nr:DUF3237 domain-containing protein [Polyangiaceae bacterium]
MSDQGIRISAVRTAQQAADQTRSSPRSQGGDRSAPAGFRPELQFIALVMVKFKPPVMLGRSPEGLRLDFHAQGGTVQGEAITARVRENSADYMVIRRDGMGLLNIRATLETDDGALIAAQETGLIDFGEDGYARIAAGDFPDGYHLQASAKFLTEHPKYQWMNRVGFVGAGYASVKELILRYELFAVRTPSSNEG